MTEVLTRADLQPQTFPITASSRRAFRFDLLRNVSPFDVRLMLAVIVLPTIWKLLSLDFSALRDLCTRPPLQSFEPDFLFQFVLRVRCELNPILLQVVTAIALASFVIKPSRFFLLPAIAGLWLLDTTAALYRWNMYDLDTPLAILTLVAVLPVSIRSAANNSRAPAAAARAVAVTALVYVSSYYVVAGISKLVFAWDWPLVVGLGNYYPTRHFWWPQELPPAVDATASFVSNAFLRYPVLGVISAFVILVEQFLWILAPFNSISRVQTAIFTTISHLTIALTTGIVFFTWLFIPLAVALPFSMRQPPRPPKREKCSASLAFALVLPLVATLAPSAFGLIVPPFYNYAQFGWRYQPASKWSDIYRVGYSNPRTGNIESFPLNQGGFFEYRQSSMLSLYARIAITDTAQRSAAATALHTILLATRKPESNAWLMGSLKASDHLLANGSATDMTTVGTFYLMRGHPTGEDIKWEVCGEIDDAGSLKLNDECRATK